jgi:hypothetical protein
VDPGESGLSPFQVQDLVTAVQGQPMCFSGSVLLQNVIERGLRVIKREKQFLTNSYYYFSVSSVK